MKILIVRVGAMGDVLHALPAVAALRQARPDWTIDWVVDPRWSPLLVDGEGRGPVVSRVHLADTRLWSRAPLSWATMRSVTSLRRALRAEKYDAVVDMQGTLRSAVIGRMAGARDLVGYGDPRERMARHLYSARVQRLAFPQGLKPLSNNALDGGTKVPPLPSSTDGKVKVPPLQSSTDDKVKVPPLPSSSDDKVRVPPLPSENFDATEAWSIPNAHVVEQGAALLGEATGVELKPAVVELPREFWAEHWAETEAVISRPLCVLGAGGGWAAGGSAAKAGAAARRRAASLRIIRP